ncbi:MAG: aminotransferase class V-fold PLP-dependent enzyme [Myxococcota bacterium]
MTLATTSPGPEAAYLNHAGTSWPKPKSVRSAVAAALDRAPTDWAAAFEAQHGRLGRAFGLGHEHRLLLTPGCTSALAIAIQDLPWRAGDVVALSAFEHVAVERPCAGLGRLGVESQVLPSSRESMIDLAATERLLAHRPVRLLVVSAAANTTGDLLPVAELGALARRYDARLLVDAAQVAGWMSLADYLPHADMMAFGAHKGMQGVWGIGGLVLREELAMATPRLNGGLAKPGWCDGGSVDRLALSAWVAALDWLDAPAQADRLDRARTLSARLQWRLQGLEGVKVLARHPPEARLPTVAMALDDARRLVQIRSRLAKAGIVHGAGLQCAPLAHQHLGTAEQGTLRFSFGPSSRDEDLDRLLSVLDRASTDT